MQDLIGLVLPPLVDLINQRVTDHNWRFIIALGVCGVAGVLLNLDKLQTGNVEEIAQSVAVVFATSQISYKLYWDRSQIRDKMNLDPKNQ